MPKYYTFVIDSDGSGHTLSLNGDGIGQFATLEAAEAEAAKAADRIVPGAILKFELDFKWTMSDVETRVATLQSGIAKTAA